MNPEKQENLMYSIALTLIPGVGDITAKHLLQLEGSPKAIFKEKKASLEKVPRIGAHIAAAFQDGSVLKQAEQECLFIEKNQIQCLFYTNDDYPKRLKECADSPILLYYKGKASLEKTKVLSVVGTRHASEYGKASVEQLLSDLAKQYPDLLIVSGLAYGIDIAAHKQALQQQLPTVAVLAHGLDRIYPAQHRNIAVQMLDKGGLLTEFRSGTNPDRQNFVKRNRIVAGLSDATLVIESANKGGALITADIAFSYGRDVLAVPGKTTDSFSAGCNQLIKQNKAALIESAQDILDILCWETTQVATTPEAIQTALFVSLSEKEKEIYTLLTKDSLQINLLAVQTNMAVHLLTPILFEMEMKGVIKCMPGGLYKAVY